MCVCVCVRNGIPVSQCGSFHQTQAEKKKFLLQCDEEEGSDFNVYEEEEFAASSSSSGNESQTQVT